MPRAGYTGTVKASGAAVVMTAEACTSLGSNRYQITNTAKRIVDPNTALVVLENGVASVLAYTFDHLFGKNGKRHITATNEIASELGKNPSQVSRIRTAILNQFQDHMRRSF